MSLTHKREHVRRAKQTRNHKCHWPGCGTLVPPAKWGCAPHWFKLPIRLRRKLWRAYVIGQEETMSPSKEYLKVAEEIQDWIAENAKSKTEHAHSDPDGGAGIVGPTDNTESTA